MLVKDDTRWNQETEVLVVGLGGAGAVAAITAHDEKARVCILEKQAEAAQMTNTSMSGGLFIQCNSIEAATEYMTHLNAAGGELQWSESDVVQAWAEYAFQNKEWLESLGGHVKLYRKGGEHHHVPGCDSLEILQPAGMGRGLMKLLKENIRRRNIEVIYSAPALNLLTNPKGEVIGVHARREGREFNIRASRAVIMTPGGFEFDEEMKLNFLRVYPSYFYGSPANTGDGIRMAQDVGAAFWHMNCCSGRLVLKFADFPIAFAPDYAGFGTPSGRPAHSDTEDPCGFVIVDRRGKRYTNEGEIKTHTLYYETTLYDSQRLEFPRVPSFWVFDDRRIRLCPLASRVGPTGAHKLYQWSKDNRVELEKGWIVKGETIAELEDKLQIETGNLEKTIEKYNVYCVRKEDPEFKRPPQCLKALDKPPYFAVNLFPGGPNTQGGPRRNKRAQILNTDGKAIPGLYAAGEFGSIFGMIYPAAGGNISECIAFGRIAGENAAQENLKQ
jgi:succinate dehydrogenase/fumarate reductase flavoprotein subunit